jgi:putative ABC transport system permease protein
VLNAMQRALRRLANVLRWSSLERDLRDEHAHHLAMAAASHRRRGAGEAEARRLAALEFGGDRWLEASRSARGVGWLQDTLRDARYGVRALARRPGYALAVIVVMALGIGATTAVYGLVRGALLGPLPYAQPEFLYTLLEGDEAGRVRLLSYPTFRDVAGGAGADAELAFVRGDNLIVRDDAGTYNLLGAFVTPNWFELLGRDAVAGRTFDVEEHTQPVAVLSARIATRIFGDARAALGGTLVTPEGVYTVIGVMPVGFSYPVWADLWLPLEALPPSSAYALEQRDLHVDSDVLVRVPPESSPAQVAAALATPIARAAAAHPSTEGDFDRAVLTPLRDRVLGPDPPRAGVLLGSVALVLVLACVNIAGLVLARGMARRGELAARLALGAGRGRLVRQLMTESVVLGVIGGAAGVLLAHFALGQLQQSAATLLPRLDEVRIGGGVLLLAIGVTLFSACAAGGIAALRATAGITAEAMRSVGRTATGDRAAVRLRGALVVVQIGLAVVLLVSASLLLRTARELARLDLGFEAAGLVVLRVTPPDRYSDDDARLMLYERLRVALENVPAVERVVLANHVPLSRAAMPTAVRTERVPDAGANVLALFRSVSHDYLAAIGARAARGRLLETQDAYGTGVVVNETLARREWGEADPIGRPITVFRSAQGAAGFGEPLPGHVVGVVHDIREQGPEQNVAPAIYVPLERNVWTSMHFVVKTTMPPAAITPALRAAVRGIDADIPTAGPHASAEFRPIDDYYATMTQTRRFTTTLLSVFAGVAVVLAVTGLFAILAFIVAQRTREIGIRMALGARRQDAAALVVRQSARLVLIGLAIGVAAAVPASHFLEASLVGVQRFDPLSYVAACMLFLATAAVAAWLPARRAARVQPVTALRSE